MGTAIADSDGSYEDSDGDVTACSSSLGWTLVTELLTQSQLEYCHGPSDTVPAVPARTEEEVASVTANILKLAGGDVYFRISKKRQ